MLKVEPRLEQENLSFEMAIFIGPHQGFIKS